MKISELCGIAASNGNQILGLNKRNITYTKVEATKCCVRVISTIHRLIMPDNQTLIMMQVLTISLLTNIYHSHCIYGGLSALKLLNIS